MNDYSFNHHHEAQLKLAVRVAGLLLVLLTASCAGTRSGPMAESVRETAPPIVAVTATPMTASDTLTGALPQVVATTGAAITPDAKVLSSVPLANSEPGTKAGPVPVPTHAKVLVPPSLAGQLPKTENAPKALAKTDASPPLDMKSLETRLKETKGIGVFTKLALKNQVDDLLNQFRAFYQGQLKITLAELRRPYEMLLLKVLALLQDSDPSLAGAIVASREAIWGILADRAKFASI